MKKIYKQPVIKVIKLDSTDIICTSPNYDNTPRWIDNDASSDYESL